MSLTRVAVYRPIVVVIALAIIAVAGALSFRGLGQDFLPQVSLPVVTVAIPYPGAGAIEVEEQVTRIVEDQIGGLADVDDITSTSRAGGTSIVVTFREGVDAEGAALRVRQRVDAARRELPASILEPTVGRINITDIPVMTLALVSPDATATELYRQADVVVRRVIEVTDGVGSVRVLGGRKPEAHVTVDPDNLRALGIGLSDLVSALGSQFTSTAAGQVRSGTGSNAREASLRIEGRGTSLERLMSLPVRVPGAKPVRLGDIASVDQDGADPDSIIRFNGKSAVGLLVFKVSDANLTQVVDRLRSRLPEANAALPSGYQLEVVSDASREVRASVNDVGVEFALASLITSLVLLLFLHKGRTTLIVLLAIPTSLAVTLIAMRYLGISLNIMSLLGLTTCIGILVDDSIVVIETIARRMEPGVDPREAAVQGRGEIGLAAVAITLVDVVVYGPVAVVSGATGEFLRNFALVIVVATLASLLVSFTLAPLLAARWLAVGGGASWLERAAASWEPLYKRLVGAYGRVLDVSVAHPWRVIAGSIVVLVATLALVPRIGTEFVPDQNGSTVTVAGELAGDASPAASEAAAREWEALLSDRAAFPEVRSIFTTVGSGATDRDRGSRFFNITLDIGPGATRGRTNQQIQRRAVEVARAIPGLKPVARASEGGTGGLQVRVFAATLPDLVAGSEVVRQRLAARPELLDVTVSGGSPSREVIAQVDSQRLGDFGLSTDQVGVAARTAYQGVVAAKLPRPDGTQVDVRLRLSDAVRHDARAVAELPIARVGDAMVTLRQVATLVEAQTPAQITRVGRQRFFTVAALPNGVPLGSATEAARAALASPELPPGVRWEFAGGSRAQAEAFTQLGLAIGAGVLLSYAVLAVLFGSFVQPFIVLLCLPFALIGALLGLLFFGYTLNLLSLIGLLALFGLVGKNSILLVDAANMCRARGLSTVDALRAAGALRLRPILMTSLTLMLGLAPVAIGLGEGGTIRAPLTAVIVGGMATSTALTLVFVPAIYVLLDRLTATAGSLARRLTHRPGTTSTPTPRPTGALGA